MVDRENQAFFKNAVTCDLKQYIENDGNLLKKNVTKLVGIKLELLLISNKVGLFPKARPYSLCH